MESKNSYEKFIVSKIIPETSDTKTFVLTKEDGTKPIYQSGQFITFVFQTFTGEKRRSYSISSSPGIDEEFFITIKRMDNGEFSRSFIERTKIGDVLFSSGISGFFRLNERTSGAQQFLFFAAGSGITPCFSIIKTILYTTEKKVLLVYSNRTDSAIIFHDSLNDLKIKFGDRIVIKYFISNPLKREGRRINKDAIVGVLNEFTDSKQSTEFYLCGPHQYMRSVSITLISEGIARESIHKENFNDEAPPVRLLPPDTNEHIVIIRSHDNKYSIKVEYPATILAAAKSNHINLPYSCENGRCGSCVARKIKGDIWLAYNEVLTDKDLREGLILTCQAYPVNGDAEIIV